MKARNNDSDQYDRSEQPKSKSILQPIEITLRNYPRTIQVNYPKLSRKDLHLAEIFRIGAKGSIVPRSEKKLNPLQTKTDGQGRIWVDVMLERNKGVKISELKKIMQVHGKPGYSRFVSGRVRVDNLPKLNKKAIRLQTARPITATLNNSVKAISASRTVLNNNGFGDINGSGVIIGIVDDGCDFNHPNFKKDTETRLLYLWDQNGKKGNGKHRPDHYNYGVEYDRTRINQVLTLNRDDPDIDPYKELDYSPTANAHGTHVMDIAAGNSSNPDFLGVAPSADLIFVQLGSPSTIKKIAKEEMKTLGSSKYLYDAVKYIFEKADEEGRTAVINISLASNGGSHDGTSLLETLFDDLLKTPGRAIVIAAGNDFLEKSHTSGKVTSQENSEILWVIPKADNPNWKFRQELEIWYPGDKKLTVEVLPPKSTSSETCSFGNTLASDESDATPLWLISNNRAEKEIDKDENYVHILVDNSSNELIGGEWRITLSTEDSEADFYAWIELNTGSPSTEFADNFTRNHTINGIGNATLPVVVGSWYKIPNVNPPSYIAAPASSSGPSRNSQFPQKPELSAPGENISSAQALDNDLSDLSGTSAAAPHVTGVIALMFQKGLDLPEPKTLKMQEIRDILIQTVDKNPPSAEDDGYDSRLGFGRVNALNVLKKITN